MGDLIIFGDGEKSKRYKEQFHTMLSSCGKQESECIRVMRKIMIDFFVNSFLTMTCLSAYNETNLNRLLVSYKPFDSIRKSEYYSVVKRFKNLYWAESMLRHWSSYSLLQAVTSEQVHLTVISFSDLVMFVIFAVANKVISLHPSLLKGVIFGNPFYVRDIIYRYWFLHGLSVREVYEYKFHHIDFLAWRKKQYLKECLKINH